MNIAICDDEIVFLELINHHIKNVLCKYAMPVNINLFHRGRELLAYKELKKFDIIFLDIELNDTNGIELAKSFRNKGYDGLIVFITSHLDYSMLGYEVEAFRYILKSNLDKELSECVHSAIKKLDIYGASVVFKINNENMKMKLKDIFYVESNDHKIIFHMTDNSSYVTYDKLNEIEEKISSDDFYRIHQSFLVNSKYIKKIKRYSACLKNNFVLPISKSRYNNVEDQMLIKENKWT